MRKLCVLGVVFALALTAVAQASAVKGGDQSALLTGRDGVGHGGAAGAERVGPICILPLSNVPSMDGYGDPSNVVVNVDLTGCYGLPAGSSLEVNGISWDVFLFADPSVGPYGGSWLSELRLAYGDTAGNDYLFLTPGAGNSFPGAGHFSSNGTIKLADVGIPNFILPNGVLQLEFFEGFDDANDVQDGTWLDGYLDIQIVPEPATLALLGLGLPLLRRKKR